MSEADHIKALVAGDRFCRALADIAAAELRQFSPGVREEIRAYLQDRTSLYSPLVADRIRKLLRS